MKVHILTVIVKYWKCSQSNVRQRHYYKRRNDEDRNHPWNRVSIQHCLVTHIETPIVMMRYTTLTDAFYRDSLFLERRPLYWNGNIQYLSLDVPLCSVSVFPVNSVVTLMISDSISIVLSPTFCNEWSTQTVMSYGNNDIFLYITGTGSF